MTLSAGWGIPALTCGPQYAVDFPTTGPGDQVKDITDTTRQQLDERQVRPGANLDVLENVRDEIERRGHNLRNDTERGVRRQNERDRRIGGDRRQRHSGQIHEIHQHRQVEAGQGERRLAGLVAGRQVLLGHDALEDRCGSGANDHDKPHPAQFGVEESCR